MKTSKKTGILLAAALLLAVLAGCGGQTPGTEQSGGGDGLDPNKTYYTVTYHYNGGAGDESVQLEADTRVAEPETPAREGFVFDGWYEDETFSQKYVFGAKITSDLELYAQWSSVFTFEAEDVSFAGKSSPVYSGAISGTAMISPDIYGRNASNGYYVMGLYAKTDSTYDTTLEFSIVASEACDNAKLYLRLSGAFADFTVNGSTYQVIVNGTAYSYSDISFACPEGVDAYSAYVNFEDYLVSSSVKLNAGENTVQLVVNNSDSLGGTTRATAPCVDAIKISVPNGTLSWGEGFPRTANYADED